MNDVLRELLSEDSRFGLSNLPYWWDQFEPEERTGLLVFYCTWFTVKPWAWEGLRRLLETLMERREPIPVALQRWATFNAIGRIRPPTRVGPPNKDDRDLRIFAYFRSLRRRGYGVEEAYEKIAAAIDQQPQSVRSARTPKSVRSVILKVREGPFRVE